MKAVVLAAGMGTRMGALTTSTPKPLLPVGGEPLLAHTLRHLSAAGVDWVAVNLHFMPEAIRAAIGDGSGFGVHVHYTYEEVLLGTAGTVRALAPLLAGEEATLVLYGDLLLDQDLGVLLARHREKRADATLLLHQRVGSNSLVRTDDEMRITGFIERPTEEERRASPFPWVNSGVAVVGPALLAAIPPDPPRDFPRDVYAPNVERLRLFGVPLTGYRCAIDSPERLAQADEAVRSGRCVPRRRSSGNAGSST